MQSKDIFIWKFSEPWTGYKNMIFKVVKRELETPPQNIAKLCFILDQMMKGTQTGLYPMKFTQEDGKGA